MSTDIQVNDKVVCIEFNQLAYTGLLFNRLPKVGGIYCVSNVEESQTDHIIIDLVGFKCARDKNGDTYGFPAEWFRKIIPASERGMAANANEK